MVDQPTVTTRLNIQRARGKNNAVDTLRRQNAALVYQLMRCLPAPALCIPFKLFLMYLETFRMQWFTCEYASLFFLPFFQV